VENKNLNDLRNKKDQESVAGDFIISLILLAVSVFVVIESLRMPEKGKWGFFMGPGFFPLILAFALLCLTLFLLISSITAKGPSGVKPLFQRLKGGLESRRFLIIAGWTAIYVALIGTIPFLFINFIYFFGIFFYLKVGRLWKVIILSLGSSLLVGYITPWIFDMPLP
jgi:hypothetical protein